MSNLERLVDGIQSRLLGDPIARARMQLIGKLENEIHRSANSLIEKYTDALVTDRYVGMAIRATVNVWTDEHKLTPYERDYLFRTADRVIGVKNISVYC